jgi:hypothetical protein
MRGLPELDNELNRLKEKSLSCLHLVWEIIYSKKIESEDE